MTGAPRSEGFTISGFSSHLLRIALGIAPLTACTDLECGLGTYEREGQCVPNLLVACGPGTRYERGYCVAVDTVDSETADASGATD